MKFRYIFLFVVLLTGIFSYLYSREIYSFYVRTYYLSFKKVNPERAAEKAWHLYKSEDYDSLRSYIEDMLFLFPQNNEIRRVAGLYYMDKGDRERGARLLLLSLDDKPDRILLARSIEVLFQNKLYVDILEQLSRFRIEDDLQLTYIRGISYYKLGRYREALRSLRLSEKLGNKTVEVYYYIALVYESMENYAEAIRYLSRAGELSPMNRAVTRTLIRLYRKDGQLTRAERLLRRGVHRR